MNFFKQIQIEFKYLRKRKFIMIFAAIMLILGFIGPVITAITSKSDDNFGMYGGGYYGDFTEDITVDGVTISPTNPFYGEIYHITQDVPMMLESLTAEEKPYAEEIMQLQTEFYVEYAQEVTNYEDYRIELIYSAQPLIAENYVLQADPSNITSFTTAVNSVAYVEELEKLLALTKEEKALKLEENEELLQGIEQAVLGDDFQVFCDNMIEMNLQQIESYERQIEVQEEAMVANPDLEQSGGIEITRLENEIVRIQDTLIPTWEYRKEKNLMPNEDGWENNALGEVEMTMYRISEEPMIEEIYLQDPYMQEVYGSYASYLKGVEKEKVEAQNDLTIAQKSLETGNPDMKFVRDGARNAVNGNLMYSLVVSFFAILIGGFTIANEFQSGTIRLMMIRPTTRWKVYASKFIAGLLLAICVYFIGMLLNIIINGILLGFGDYGYPNYTATGEVNFWGMILMRTLICMFSIIAFYAIAFGFSALIRNVAVAIIIPSAVLFGGSILNSILLYTSFVEYLPYTPLPYIFLYQFYSEYGIVDVFREKGIDINTGIGVIMLLFIAALFFVIGLLSFKKKDITN